MPASTSRLAIVAALAVAAAVIAGCAKDPMKLPPGGRADLLPVKDYPQIVATQGLHEYLAFSPATVTASSDEQPMEVFVPVRSLYDKGQFRLQYRFEFFDERGRPVGPAPGYRFAVLEPRVAVHLHGNAMETTAADWRLEIRPAR